MSRAWLIAAFTALVLSGCAHMTGPLPAPGPDPGGQMLARLVETRPTAASFKGDGRFRLWEKQQLKVSQRVLWIGAAPDRIRMLVRTLSGIPLVSLANDGKTMTLEFHQQRRFYKAEAADASLSRFIAMPVHADTIWTLLAGGIPLQPHTRVILEKDDEGPLLVLKDGWQGTVEKLYLEKDRQTLRRIEIFTAGGHLAYRIEFGPLEAVGAHRLPTRIEISNASGNRLVLDMERNWVDVPTDPSLFVLKPPDENG
jgi:outer membrane biogenesis lipoprotein LolB